MSANILIRDGDPWWLSPDIRVVPGDDPNGATGQPVAGRANYVWATVHNTGKSAANGIVVNFYWSNPAGAVLRSNSTLIGTAYVDLGAGETKEVLCLTPWMAVIVNEGHECLVVEAITSSDPLPQPLPDDFDPRSFHQVAQKNLHVLIGAAFSRAMVMPIQISAPQRRPKKVRIALQHAELKGDDAQALFASIGVTKVPKPRKDLVKVHLAEKGDCGAMPSKGHEEALELSVPEGTSAAAYVHVERTDVQEPGYQLIHVLETHGKEIIGGNSILIINP